MPRAAQQLRGSGEGERSRSRNSFQTINSVRGLLRVVAVACAEMDSPNGVVDSPNGVAFPLERL